MTTRSNERELLELETRYWQAMKDHDVDAALKLTDDPCVIVGAQGLRSIDHATFAQLMQSTAFTIHSFRIDAGSVGLRLSDDVAVIAYKVTEELTMDGRPVMIEAADSSVWRRTADGWRCSLHTESVMGDSFRTPA